MSKIKTTLVTGLAISCLAIGSTAGFVSGRYLTTEKMQKTAVAHSCGTLDPKTLEFSWLLQPSLGIAIDAMPDYRKKR